MARRARHKRSTDKRIHAAHELDGAERVHARCNVTLRTKAWVMPKRGYVIGERRTANAVGTRKVYMDTKGHLMV